MENRQQNNQVEVLAKIARDGGGYSWSSTPISDSGARGLDHGFYLANSQEKFQRDARTGTFPQYFPC